jgi:hypothetical protein
VDFSKLSGCIGQVEELASWFQARQRHILISLSFRCFLYSSFHALLFFISFLRYTSFVQPPILCTPLFFFSPRTWLSQIWLCSSGMEIRGMFMHSWSAIKDLFLFIFLFLVLGNSVCFPFANGKFRLWDTYVCRAFCAGGFGLSDTEIIRWMQWSRVGCANFASGLGLGIS